MEKIQQLIFATANAQTDWEFNVVYETHVGIL